LQFQAMGCDVLEYVEIIYISSEKNGLDIASI